MGKNVEYDNMVDGDDSRMDDVINTIKQKEKKRKTIFAIGIISCIVLVIGFILFGVFYGVQREREIDQHIADGFQEFSASLNQVEENFNKETDAIIQDVQDAQQKLEEEQQNK